MNVICFYVMKTNTVHPQKLQQTGQQSSMNISSSFRRERLIPLLVYRTWNHSIWYYPKEKNWHNPEFWWVMWYRNHTGLCSETKATKSNYWSFMGWKSLKCMLSKCIKLSNLFHIFPITSPVDIHLRSLNHPSWEKSYQRCFLDKNKSRKKLVINHNQKKTVVGI